MSNTVTKLSKEEALRETAKRYLADKIYLSVLGKSQSLKIRQVLKGIDVEGITLRLLRNVMANNSRFETVDHRWAASVRFGDTQRPFERVLQDIFISAGIPLTVTQLAAELAQVYSRTVAYYGGTLPKILKNKEKFFAVDGAYGLASWLIIPADEEDIIFDSFISNDQVAEFSEICPEVEWTVDTIADAAAAVVTACKEPIPLKILALFAWRALGEDFDAVDFYAKVIADERIMVLSDQKVYPASAAKGFAKTIAKLADELSKLPMEAEEEEADGPVTVTDTDKEEIIKMIIEKGSASAEELLDSILEVSQEDPAFAGTLESLKTALAEEERIMWLGGTRWGKVEVFPEEVTEIPASLIVPAVQPFETPEGDVFDQMLEEDGFEGNLKSAVYDPLAEDITDEDPARTKYQPNGDSQRCVLKYHHKQEGTFPLCQINPNFFGAEPEIIPIVLIDEGKRKTCYVNNTTRLIYGLKDLCKDITEVSGAVFYIEKTAKSGEYRFKFDGEVDSQLGIDLNRSLELMEEKHRFESSDMPIYDVITDILGKQGMTFAQLTNEVNIVKRCSRLLVASILISYHAFHTRGKSDQWLFDEKKKSQGFNKTKRKYIKKD
ncbi:MAG: hypothetical protein NT018_01690 [Armatimonadetes bacterium]|nr:hypothetical protein [Armatimonadota bacterium]